MVCLLGSLLAACDNKQAQTNRPPRESKNHPLNRGDAESLENSSQTAVEAMRGINYADARPACIRDCSDKTAGFAWAKENSIFDANSCTGNTAPFIEGCRAYAEEVQKRASTVEVNKESE